jgi:hypothetical protein
VEYFIGPNLVLFRFSRYFRSSGSIFSPGVTRAQVDAVLEHAARSAQAA